MSITLNHPPVVKTEMLIRKPVNEVFQAFVDPEITTKFWFTKSSDTVVEGRTIRWDWEMYGVSDEIQVKRVVENEYILVESSDGTEIEWTFQARKDSETMVSIQNSGFTGNGDEMVNRALDSMGGYTMVLCGLKAFLEYSVTLHLVEDKAPDAHVK